MNKNDRPLISRSQFRLPRPLPYNYSDITGDGASVSEILTAKTVSDPDGGEIGT